MTKQQRELKAATDNFANRALDLIGFIEAQTYEIENIDVLELLMEVGRLFTPEEVFGDEIVDEIGTKWAHDKGLLTPGILKGWREGR